MSNSECRMSNYIPVTMIGILYKFEHDKAQFSVFWYDFILTQDWHCYSHFQFRWSVVVHLPSFQWKRKPALIRKLQRFFSERLRCMLYRNCALFHQHWTWQVGTLEKLFRQPAFFRIDCQLPDRRFSMLCSLINSCQRIWLVPVLVNIFREGRRLEYKSPYPDNDCNFYL